jgi:hypothetical protein
VKVKDSRAVVRRNVDLSPYSQYRTGVFFKIVKNRRVHKTHRPFDLDGNPAFEKEYSA